MMRFSTLTMLLGLFVISTPCFAGESDWSQWRGPDRNGIAEASQNVPLKWGENENILWKATVPGRGHGSPIVVGDCVYLATAERDRQARSLLCLHRNTGKQVWLADVHVGKETPYKNEKGSDASSTPAYDGERLFINFLHDDAMYTSAVSLEGEILWQTKVCDYKVHQAFGSSPTVYDSLVIVIGDNKLGGAVAGLNRETGEIVWKQERPKFPNYASPVIFDVNGTPQLLLTGCELVSGLNPLSGEKIWEFEGATTECVTTTPLYQDLMFTTGGYPKNHVAAVKCDGSGKVVWENGTRVYVPSMLVKEGVLYGVTDAGVAVCWTCETGQELWKGRLGGTFSSSPVMIGDKIHVTNEEGKTYIFNTNPQKFELLSENQLANECFATPVICGDRIYTRLATITDGNRQESLYCIGKK